jgi:hypothetical protein
MRILKQAGPKQNEELNTGLSQIIEDEYIPITNHKYNAEAKYTSVAKKM